MTRRQALDEIGELLCKWQNKAQEWLTKCQRQADRIAELEAQRDALLAACYAALDTLDYHEYSDGCDCMDCIAYRELTAAVARAREEVADG